MKKWIANFDRSGTFQEWLARIQTWIAKIQEWIVWLREWAIWTRDWMDGVGEHSPWVRNHMLLEKLHRDLGDPGYSSNGVQLDIPKGIGIISPSKDEETTDSSDRILILSSLEWKESAAPAKVRR